jgi:hypothetical protein
LIISRSWLGVQLKFAWNLIFLVTFILICVSPAGYPDVIYLQTEVYWSKHWTKLDLTSAWRHQNSTWKSRRKFYLIEGHFLGCPTVWPDWEKFSDSRWNCPEIFICMD